MTALRALTLAELDPPPDLTVSEWAEAHRVLSDEAAAEPGRWRNSRTPYLVGIMDAFNDPMVEDIVVKKSAQIGYTETLNNIVGYIVAHDPGPTLVIQPNLDMAKAWTTDRFDTMVTDTPELARKVAEQKSRDKSNTTFHKTFPDGHLTIIGANSSAGLKSRPIRYLICDEIDEYPFTNQKTGDPVEKAKKRTATFRGRRKRIFGSTPSVEDASRVDAMFKDSDQRRFFVPCPHCRHFQTLKHEGLTWPESDPMDAQYCCEDCGALIDETHKSEMLAAGEWRATTDAGKRGLAGFAINELYSPFVSWGEYAENFIVAKRLPETLQTFVNESMGEVWSEDGSKIESEVFLDRLENYDVPTDVLFLTMTVDTQIDRLECYIKGWGTEGEGWGIAHHVIEGDPDVPERMPASPWRQVTELWRTRYEVEDGRRLSVPIVLIDSGGQNTDAVYRYCKSHRGAPSTKVHPIKGVGGNHPSVGRIGRGNKHRVAVYPIGVNGLKTKVFNRLKVKEPGPGFQHYNTTFDTRTDAEISAGESPEWFRQLTAERMVKRKVRGFQTIEWVKRRDRNEAFDLEVYSIAAVEILSPDYNALIEKRERFLERSETGDAPIVDDEPVAKTTDSKPSGDDYPTAKRKKKTARNRPRRGGFANSWRV